MLTPLNSEDSLSVNTTRQLSKAREGEIYFSENKDNVRKGAVGCELAWWKATEKETFWEAKEGSGNWLNNFGDKFYIAKLQTIMLTMLRKAVSLNSVSIAEDPGRKEMS